MKNSNVKTLWLTVTVSLLFAACTKDDPEMQDPTDPIITGSKVMYILNEGLWNQNNATISVLNFLSGTVQNDYFQAKNGRPLGDVSNDIAQYGSKMYCVVNVSSTIEIFDAKSGKSIRQIKIVNEQQEGRQPSKITFWKNKAYVCNYDGTVTRIDTATFSIDNLETGTIYSDGICAVNNKIYVSNSMGTSAELCVINTNNFTRVKTIPVGTNPGKIELDSQGNLLLLSRGNNYSGTPSCLQKINTQTDAVDQTYNNKATGFSINGNYAYVYLSEYENPNFSFFRLNTQTGSIENLTLDKTRLSSIIYSIGIDSDNGNIYIGCMMSYSEPGDIVCFDQNGNFKSKYEVGFCPSKVVFVKL